MPKVIVADDDPRMVRLLSATLPSDYEVVQATDGAAAIAMAEATLPDLLLLDVNLPGMNGFEVLRRMKESETLRHIRVIMVTARSDEVDRNLGLQTGADAYLTKPFSPLALLEKASELLGEQ
jgi:two-component system alkaline phosphatase synthesis response regulator PhoP